MKPDEPAKFPADSGTRSFYNTVLLAVTNRQMPDCRGVDGGKLVETMRALVQKYETA